MEKKRKQDEKRQRKNDRKAAELAAANAPPPEPIEFDEDGEPIDAEPDDTTQTDASASPAAR